MNSIEKVTQKILETGMPWWITVTRKLKTPVKNKQAEKRPPVRYWTVEEWKKATPKEKRG